MGDVNCQVINGKEGEMTDYHDKFNTLRRMFIASRHNVETIYDALKLLNGIEWELLTWIASYNDQQQRACEAEEHIRQLMPVTAIWKHTLVLSIAMTCGIVVGSLHPPFWVSFTIGGLCALVLWVIILGPYYVKRITA